MLINPYQFDQGFNVLTSIAWHSVFWANNPYEAHSDGAAVSSWMNYGTLGTPATQATGTKQPTYRSTVAAYNNRSAIEFDKTDDDLVVAAFTAVTVPWTVVVVGNLAATLDSGDTIFSGTNLSNNGTLKVDTNTFTADSADSGVARTTNPVFFGAVFDSSSNGKIFVGSTTVTGAATGSGNHTNIWLNTDRGSASTCAGGHRAFVGIYAGDLSLHSRWAEFKAWVTSYYGITT